MTDPRELAVGDVIHGFAGGMFGRDSYSCRRVEAIGPDWVLTRNDIGKVEMCDDPAVLPSIADDRSYCYADCDGSA